MFEKLHTNHIYFELKDNMLKTLSPTQRKIHYKKQK